jgi:hypothetical protein
MNKKQREQMEAVDTLKQWGVVDGSTVYAKVNNVSSSGMSRNITLYVVIDEQLKDISWLAARALEWPYREGYNGGVRVTGCGMDMMFHTVDSLSYVMGYGEICQTRDRVEPIEKRGVNGAPIKAIGLKYCSL